ncbi:hypothetical protein AMTRI_Chr08g206600 [Amborella trichopoda]
MTEFWDFIFRNNLLDIPLQGTASPDPTTLSKLDRFLLALNWEERFPGSHAMALPKPTSDHCPILHCTQALNRGPKPFRFELARLEEKSLSSLIPTWWNSLSSQVEGRASFKLQSKIQLLKAPLKTWSWSIPGNYTQVKSSLLLSIQELDRLEESRSLTTSEANLRTQTKLDYFSSLKKEELCWFQRSRVNWLKVGDHNTRFIHRIANCRRRDNSISIIKSNNRYLVQPREIESAILYFF